MPTRNVVSNASGNAGANRVPWAQTPEGRRTLQELQNLINSVPGDVELAAEIERVRNLPHPDVDIYNRTTDPNRLQYNDINTEEDAARYLQELQTNRYRDYEAMGQRRERNNERRYSSLSDEARRQQLLFRAPRPAPQYPPQPESNVPPSTMDDYYRGLDERLRGLAEEKKGRESVIDKFKRLGQGW